MSKKIEIHTVVELNDDASNRDRNGKLKKTTDAHGVIHQYHSRQCINREIRENKMLDPNNRQGIKVTRPEMEAVIRDEIAKLGLTDTVKVEKIVDGILVEYGMKKKAKANDKDKKKGNKKEAEATEATEATNETATENNGSTKKENVDNLTVFLSAREIEHIVAILSENDWASADDNGIKKAVEETRKKLQMSEDVALFGRMIASNAFLNVRGAVSGTDLIGVTRMNSVHDFYTSNGRNDGRGATNMGNIEMNSGVFYQTTIIDVDQLRDNIRDEDTVRRMLTWDYLKDFAECVGKGRQHGKFCRTRPTYIALVVTEGNAQTMRHSSMYGKSSIDEIVNAMRDELEDRINDLNCSCDHAVMAEDDKIARKHDNFNEFIQKAVFGE